MSSNCYQRTRVDVPFAPDEESRFRAFLKASGRKAGPWLRTIAVRAMDVEQGLGDGSVQARELAEFMASQGEPGGAA